jgi:hypothetical protein
MQSLNQAPEAALRCLRHFCRTPITNAVSSNAAAAAELDTTARELYELVAHTRRQYGADAAVEVLPPGVSYSSSLRGIKSCCMGPAPAPARRQRVQRQLSRGAAVTAIVAVQQLSSRIQQMCT